MKLLEQVMSGKTPAPRRVMLYGVQGVGKSTWAACAPKPIFLQTEDGLGEIDCDKLPLSTTYDGSMKALSALYTEPHSYQTVVIDSLAPRLPPVNDGGSLPPPGFPCLLDVSELRYAVTEHCVQPL